MLAPLKERSMPKRSLEREGHWRGVVAAWERSGQSVRAFCAERQLNEHSFYSWRRELRRRDGASQSSGAGRPRRGRRQFVQVQVAEAPWLELRLGEDLALRVPATVDADRLVELLAAARRSLAC